MYMRLRNVNELTFTRMTLQLVDHTVGKFVLSCNFVIMNIHENVKTLTIFRRGFLATINIFIRIYL